MCCSPELVVINQRSLYNNPWIRWSPRVNGGRHRSEISQFVTRSGMKLEGCNTFPTQGFSHTVESFSSFIFNVPWTKHCDTCRVLSSSGPASCTLTARLNQTQITSVWKHVLHWQFYCCVPQLEKATLDNVQTPIFKTSAAESKMVSDKRTFEWAQGRHWQLEYCDPSLHSAQIVIPNHVLASPPSSCKYCRHSKTKLHFSDSSHPKHLPPSSLQIYPLHFVYPPSFLPPSLPSFLPLRPTSAQREWQQQLQ